MIRWVRRLLLVGAGATLFIGAVLLPWATWNNLDVQTGHVEKLQVTDAALELMRARGVPSEVIEDLRPLKDVPFADRHAVHLAIREGYAAILSKNTGGRPITLEELEASTKKLTSMGYEDIVYVSILDRTYGFYAPKSAKTQPTCFANALDATGDYRYELHVFQSNAGGKLLGIAGDPQFRSVQAEANKFAQSQAEYQPSEVTTHVNPYFAGGARKVRNAPDVGTSPIAFSVFLAILLLLLAAFLRGKVVVSLLVLPALACGLYPWVVLRDFVANTSKLKLSGIVLDPAIGSGTYVMLAGGLLAVAGGIAAWFEPARAATPPADKQKR